MTIGATPSYTVVIVAAGQGRRMGGPKALLTVPSGDMTSGEPLAAAHARAHLDRGAKRVVVVVRAEVAAVLARFARPGLEVVISSAPDELGPAGSLRTALHYLDVAPDAWLLVQPVDAPPVSPEVVAALASRAQTEPRPRAVRPVFDGRRGHPVLVSRAAMEPLLAAAPPPLRDVLAALGGDVVDVPVGDRACVVGFDTPDDVAAWYGEVGSFYALDEPTFA